MSPKAHVLKAWFPEAAMFKGGNFLEVIGSWYSDLTNPFRICSLTGSKAMAL